MRLLIVCWAIGVDFDEARARSNARELVRQFDASEQREELHDKVTWQTLSAGTRLRSDLEQFIAGAARESLVELFKFIAELAFMPVAERLTEAEHSRVNRYCAKRKASGQTVSLVLRQPEVESLLADSHWRSIFVENYLRVSSGTRIGQVFGFQRHPIWQQRRRDFGTGLSDKQVNYDQMASFVMYSLDPEARYRKYVHKARAIANLAKALRSAEVKFVKKVRGGAHKLTFDDVTCKALRDACSSHQAFDHDNVYSTVCLDRLNCSLFLKYRPCRRSCRRHPSILPRKLQ